MSELLDKAQAKIEFKKYVDKRKLSIWMPYEKEIIRYYYPQLNEWLETGMKKPAIFAFTSGLGRDIARLMEQAKLLGTKEVKSLMVDECIRIVKEHLFNTYPINCEAICDELKMRQENE